MNLNDIRTIFNRAIEHTFDKKKLLLIFATLALCGVLVVFFRGLSINAGHWILQSLTFLPIFLCTGVMLSVGIIIIRLYHDELKNKPISYTNILGNSLEIMIGASYFTIPIILSYLLLWMILGIFVLLREIPAVGEFFGVILAFGPFLLNLASLILCVFSIALLFFITPVIALNGINRIKVTQVLIKKFQSDIFSNLFLAFIAMLPLLIFISFLVLSAFMTGSIYYTYEKPLHIVLQWFFIMIPFTALLSPAVIFFFNFAAESHVLLQRKIKEK